MNYIGYKQKSLFYSLSAHLFIALLVFAFFYEKHQKLGEKRILMHLSARHYVLPTKEPVSKESKLVEKVIPKKTIKTEVPKKVVKTEVLEKSAPVKKQVVEKKVVKEAVLANTTKAIKEKNTPVENKTPLKKSVIADAQTDKKEIKPVKEVLKKEALFSASKKEEVTPTTLISPEDKYFNENIALINTLIKKYLFYPRVAKKRGKQGKVFVSFKIDENGKVSEIEALGKVAEILKKSAIKTIKKAARSFPHPQTILALSIPISYKLK